KKQPEFELFDTGEFNDNRYFDLFVEYAKADVEDILVKITVANRGPETANLRLLPTVWFRNIWSWGGNDPRPELHQAGSASNPVVELNHTQCGNRWLHCEGSPELLFTENETNARRLFGAENHSPYVKDGINDYVVHGAGEAVNPQHIGTKAAAHYKLTIGGGETAVVRMRLANSDFTGKNAFEDFDEIFAIRTREADDFYAPVIPQDLSADGQNVMRQGLSGMLWSKQFYHYVVKDWLEGDPGSPPPPPERLHGRNHEWAPLYNADVISMPDKWEYPWYAAWDLAFHCVPLALVDSDFAKDQLTLMLREWYMRSIGQIPAYEWAFGDVNPPVHAWAAWRVYKIDKKCHGRGDTDFLKRVFHKLMLNFTWWVNRKDAEGMNIFQGGFLGLDNIGVFDRSAPLPTGGYIEQSDGTSWMAMYTLNLLAIALELAKDDPVYEDMASKFWEHFIFIAHAMSHRGRDSMGLWNEEDGFFYDVLKLPDGTQFPMKIRSMVGLIPLFAVETLESEVLDRLPGFKRRLEWFVDNRPDLTEDIACMKTHGLGERRLLSVANEEQLRDILRYMLDEKEFLSPYGIRALSRFHKDQPYTLNVMGIEHRVDYEPGESVTGIFGGNSNWRGPIWFPLNFLLVESLQKFHHYLGDRFKVEFPTGSGELMTLWDVAAKLSRRMTNIFLRDDKGRRPVFGTLEKFQTDPHWRDLILFHEYFNGDSGAGVGASHQTGWTGIVTKLMQQSGESRKRKKHDPAATAASAD
ncbi:MAG TPA: glucosidase, partial [Terriglobales bacterium]|nr:glucosidase [Terriglobales bacterium]